MKERPEFPSDLEGRMDAILNVVNTEFKSYTVLHLDDRAASQEEIRDRIIDSIGDDSLLPYASSIGEYC